MISEIQSDPGWIPHTLDMQARTIEFLKVPHERYEAPGFLFEFDPPDPADRLQASLAQVLEIEVDTLPVHFVFHTAFCRSTLLSRALNIPGISIGMSEPAIISGLASGGAEAEPLVRPLLRLLGRKRDGIGAVFVKPTNHANRLIPSILRALPEARAILMTNSVAPFLQSVRKRGLMGHRWGRRLYLELQRYAGLDLGMPPEEQFAMTDLQAAGLAWLLNQNYFSQLLASPFGARLRTLDGDFFNEHRGETIEAVLKFCNVEPGNHTPATLSSSTAFAAHSKLGGNVVAKEADSVTADEIGQIAHWLDLIAGQIGISVPIPQTLL